MSSNSVQIQTQVAVSDTPSTGGATTQPQIDTTEVQQLPSIIKAWKELQAETSELKNQVREKNKRMKAMEEIILRVMKKNNIGALDLSNTGGRLLYRRSNAKGALNAKTLQTLLTDHLKSDQKAAEAVKYITENREARVRESLLYEKD